jgi:hypothetical protein
LNESTSRHSAVVEALRRYCAARPRAADSAAGLRAWLPPELRAVPAPEFERALEELVTEQVLTRRPLADGTVIFFCMGPKRQD